MAHMAYLVRKRNVLTGRERWLNGPTGEPLCLYDRFSADLTALLQIERSEDWEYSYVVELDLDHETID